MEPLTHLTLSMFLNFGALPFLNYRRREKYSTPYNPHEYDQVADIRNLLKVHIRAASILESQQNFSTCSVNYKMYFDTIYKMALKYDAEKVELVDVLLLEKFNRLLFAAHKHFAKHKVL
ncbi:MAG: hypothetical protein IPK31_14500 [Chitinophagaceae bacterium]|nr:hypothetical protein [Chitinophagaceae bacterium]